MYKIIGNFLLFALFVCASASSAQAAAYASPQGSGFNIAKKCVLTLTVSNSTPSKLIANWTATPGGAFTVRLHDATGAVLRQVVTTALTVTFDNLASGDYRISVSQSPCVLISDLVTVI